MAKKRMTKKEAEALFRAELLPGVPNKLNGKVSFSQRIMAWEYFAKGLHEDRQISDSQYNRWDYPAFCRSRGK